MEEIDSDDVGSAEELINRWINERRSLEAAQRVLQTYRMVKANLPILAAQKDALESGMTALRVNSDVMYLEFAREKERQEEAIRLEMSRLKTALSNDIASMEIEKERLQKETEEMLTDHMEVQDGLMGEERTLQDKIKVLQSQLEAMEGEHRTLVEAFRKSAELFNVGSSIL